MPATTKRPPAMVLVRHAQSTWSARGRFQGTSNPPLSADGLEQAAAVGRQLGEPEGRRSLGLPETAPLAVRHSPLERAKDTAQAITGWFDAALAIADDHLSEIGQGAWEGLTHAQVLARWAPQYEAWRHDPSRHVAPGGESLADAAVRAGQALKRVIVTLDAASTANPWVIVVAHDGILRLILLRALGIHLDRYWSFPFIQCGITIVDRRDVFELRTHNASGHLTALEPGVG